jgi:hypothetical protein
MPVDALRLIRKMRGGAQAHLLEASDGHFYVVKFLNNPQHRRILVNEWLASVFLQYLGIASPPTAMVRVSEDFLAANPDIAIQLGHHRQAVVPGWHFGSRFPGDPRRTVVYDFLPDSLLGRVENQADFRAVLVFDKWMGNTDSRQAIFYRARIQDSPSGPNARPERLGFVAQMMDNGYVFEGPHWRLPDSPLYGLYFRKGVYQTVRGWADFEPWLERIQHFPEEVVDQAVKQIPPDWLAESPNAGDEVSDRAELENLLEKLLRRRKRVPSLIEDSRKGKSDPFPEWRERQRATNEHE